MNDKKRHIILFLFTAFLFLRIADVHSFSHFVDGDDDSEHCELCEMISTSNEFAPILIDSCSDQKVISPYAYYKTVTNFSYETTNFCITLPEKIYNKPPPVA